MGVFGWIASIVGVTGVLGFIALAFFAPLVAAQLVKGAIAVLSAVWNTRPGLALIVGFACLAVGAIGGDNFGERRIQSKWDDARAAAKAVADAKDIAAAAKAAQTDQKDAAAEAATDQSDKEARDAYIAELEKRAADVCRDTDADVDRLRALDQR